MSVLNCSLNLVYPPISNQEGVWFWEDKEVREYVKSSKLYMLVHRKELKFLDVDSKEIPRGIFRFRISMGEYQSSYFSYQFTDNLDMLIEECGALDIEEGEKLFRIKKAETGDVLYWATPDKILYDSITQNIVLESEHSVDIELFQKFDLLYVGISKNNDSFSRLFEKAHHGRLNILSNENTKDKSSRMTDELMILLFEVTWFNINVLNSIDAIDDLFSYTDDEQAIVADAEKAFVSMLESKYNEVKFRQYPKGKDGLFSKGLQGYSYSINYDLTLSTDKASLVGKYENFNRDSIIIHGNEVELFKIE